MNKLFSTDPKNQKTLALLYLLIGVLLMIFAGPLLRTVARLIGLIILAYGAWALFEFFGRNKATSSLPLIYGLIAVVFGFLFLLNPNILISILPFIIGLIMIINGFVQLQRANLFRQANMPSWSANTVVAVLLIVGGFFIIFWPAKTAVSFVRIAGVMLIVEALFMYYNASESKRYL